MTVVVTIVIQCKPYQDNRAWHALRFSGAALVEDMEVRLHLLDEGVELACRGHDVPEGVVNLEELPGELIECGVDTRSCGMSIDDYGINEQDMLPGIEKGSMKALAGWVKSSDHVLTF